MSEDEIKRVMLSEVKKLATVARSRRVTVEIHDFPGQPFEIITAPGGEVADWGIGGVNKRPTDVIQPEARRLERPTRSTKGVMRRY